MAAGGINDQGRATVQQGTAAGTPACVGCHGANLQGNVAIKAPAIAVKPAAFVLSRLAHYASPAGHNAMMRQVATSMSPAERNAVAAYLAGLKAPTTNLR
jgi:cytochrome c553